MNCNRPERGLIVNAMQHASLKITAFWDRIPVNTASVSGYFYSYLRQPRWVITSRGMRRTEHIAYRKVMNMKLYSRRKRV